MNRTKVLRFALIGCLSVSAASALAGVQHAVARSEFAPLHRPLRMGARVTLPRIPLAENEPAAVLELERFQVWADNAEIKVYGAGEALIETLPPPAVQYFRGTVAGKSGSLVFLSVAGDNVEGVIYTDDRKYALGSRRFGRNEVKVIIQESSALEDMPGDGQGYTCDVEGSQINTASTPRQVLSEAVPDLQPSAAPTGTQRTVLNMAVETDYELYTRPNIASNSASVTTFIGNLFGGVSTIYSRDLFAEMRVAYLGIHTVVGDPFTINPGSTGTWNSVAGTTFTTGHALAEFGDRWHNSAPSAVPRSGAVLISGKTQTAGVAWINTFCDPDILCSGGNCGNALYDGHYGGGYAYCGGIAPPAALNVPNPDTPPYTAPASNFWPLLQTAHELGHNVGSAHTHCISLSPAQQAQYGVARSFVDICSSPGGSCYTGMTSVPAELGTIMSYCHNLAGGAPNLRFVFGLPSEASEVVLTNMRGYLAVETPALSAITAPSSLGIGVTGNASVTSVGGMTYAWTISNGVITSASNLAAITFTGSVSPAVLRVTATNTSGCSITDSVSVTLTASLAAPANVVATATTANNVALSWSAVATATGYEVWRKSSSAGAFALVGPTAVTSFNDATVSANSAYLYQVRGTLGGNGGTFSTSELATTTIFTDPTIVPGLTTLQSAHLTELLTAVNAVRTLAGLGAASFSTPATAGSVAAAAHITVLRTGVDTARTALSLGNASYTDPGLTVGTAIQAAHVTELRSRVQ